MVNFFFQRSSDGIQEISTNFVLVIGDANVIQNDLA